MRVVFTYARMNPPTDGHRALISKIAEVADEEGRTAIVYLSETQDRKKNPLPPEAKLKFLRRAFPAVEFRTSKTVFTAGLELAENGYSDAVCYVGEDRLSTFEKMLTKYLGTPDLPLEKLEVRAIERGEGAVSASKARQAVLEGDIDRFESMSIFTEVRSARELFYAVSDGMGVREDVS